MQVQRGSFLLTYMVAVAIPLSVCFNIDVTPQTVHTGKQQDFFGYKVLQFMTDTNKGIIVTAPLQNNGSGGVCNPGKSQESQCFSPEEITINSNKIPIKHLGLSIAAAPTHPNFTVCSPNLAHECHDNSYLNSVCYTMEFDLQHPSPSTPAFQECTKRTVDLVFLFDGSESMTIAEFNKNKDFIVDIIKNFTQPQNSMQDNSSIKFAAVQFSLLSRKVFDFNDYQAGTAFKKLREEPHMKSLTNTHRALKFVLKNLFENPAAGASPEATKVLVLITDGDPSDTDRNINIIKTYDEKDIIRFVIVVKNATLTKFTAIASKPKEKYAFKIENYDGLTGVLENFQKKIFNIEGVNVRLAKDMANEMAQSGFSAVFYNDTLILGSVGSAGRRGSLQEIKGQNDKFIEDENLDTDTYLGYSVSVGVRNNTPLYFTGAPRYKHVGLVVLFTQQNKTWNTSQNITGYQIGSYFGAELCSVDIDSDGNTDFLLVGAPMFYHPHEKTEGHMYVYTLTDEKVKLKTECEFSVMAPSLGRFGTTISSLKDLNGDGLRDIGVGAPLEDDNRGAVYIYLGDRQRGVRSTFSQRIMGQKIEPGLKFFGQAIHGDIDLGEDGLPDIVIGSQGTVVVLRSRPVFNVTADLSFQPEEISIEKISCLGSKDEIFDMVTLTVCFDMEEVTNSTDSVDAGLNITYTLDIDPMKQTYRGFFSQTDKKSRNHTSVYELTDQTTCYNHSIFMPTCVKDTFLPICIKLNFSQPDSEKADTVLNVDSKRQVVVEIPFKKHCSKNDICIADLEMDFNFTTSTLLVKEDNYFNVSIRLTNKGDDSYNTSLTMFYPPGLSFSTMWLTEATRPTLYRCHDLEGVLDKTMCSVSLPVYYSRSSATFKSSFYIMASSMDEWNDTVQMTITGKSDNNNSTRISSITKSIPVQFEIKMGVTVKDDIVTYLNFTAEDSSPKRLEIIYKIHNHGVKAFPVVVSLVFPTKLDHNFEMKNYQVFVEMNKTQCTNITHEVCSPEDTMITCDTFTLDKESSTEFRLSGDVHFKDLKQHAENIAFLKRYTGESAEVKFKSYIHVNYDKQRYVLDSQKQDNKGVTHSTPNQVCQGKDNSPTIKWTQIRVEFIINEDQRVITSTGIVLGLLLLIILTVIMFKLGCFKRRQLPNEEEEDEFTFQDCSSAPLPESATKDDQSETEGKSEQLPEQKNLLDDNEVNGSTSLADPKEGLPEQKPFLDDDEYNGTSLLADLKEENV